MPRFKLIVEYDGTPYRGWQRQAEGRTVQAALEEAIAAFAGGAPRTRAAGRTDAGVHASGQVVHVDLPGTWRADTVRDAANAFLRRQGDLVAVVIAEAVDDAFDARISATLRRYRYRILNRRSPPALERTRVWHVPRPLDAAAMHEAAQGLLGRHDFTTFRASQCQANSPVRTLDRLDVRREGEVIEVWTQARSFLHHQVRSMAGSLVQVGLGRWRASDLTEALHARDRARCGQLAPAAGLTLIGVEY